MAFTDQSGIFIYKLLLTYQLMDQMAENDLMMIQKDGSIALTANWDAGSYEIRSQTFQSDIATGTAPFTVASTTVVTNLNADYVDGVHVTGFATFNYSGAKVYDAAAPAAMTDLDLSGTIGANRALVYLKVKLDDIAGSEYYEFRENGETDTIEIAAPLVTGTISTNQEFIYLWILTDSSGIIEWKSDNQRNTEIYVLAYMKAG